MSVIYFLLSMSSMSILRNGHVTMSSLRVKGPQRGGVGVGAGSGYCFTG